MGICIAGLMEKSRITSLYYIIPLGKRWMYFKNIMLSRRHIVLCNNRCMRAKGKTNRQPRQCPTSPSHPHR